jgi:hypothetical protein
MPGWQANIIRAMSIDLAIALILIIDRFVKVNDNYTKFVPKSAYRPLDYLIIIFLNKQFYTCTAK